MFTVMQTRASFFMNESVGVCNIAAEMLKALPWRAVQARRRAFTRRYLGENTEGITLWVENIIVLL